MECRLIITYGLPDQSFWDKFSKLWHNSKDRSPFKSPHILQYFAGSVNGHLVVFQFFEHDNLKAAILLKENHGVFTFLSDLKTDVNFFVFDRDCSQELERKIFERFLEAILDNKWSLILNNQPSWAPYMPVFESVGKASKLFWLNFSYSVCPIATAETPEALFNRINSSRELRYRVNKLKKQENAEFEVLTNGDDLQRWVEEFCQAHILRWANTPTPSAFRDTARQKFLYDCLNAWNQDGILVRFAVKVARGRVGFVVGLREANSLVHHSTTFHPDYWKFSPGKALIHFMASWMQDNNLRVLDFGDGDEPYKYEVANEEHVLNRIFISGKYNLPFIAKARFIKMVKDHPKMYHLYQNRLKPMAARTAALMHVPEHLPINSIIP